MSLTKQEITELRPFDKWTGPIIQKDLDEMHPEACWTYENLRELCDRTLDAEARVKELEEKFEFVHPIYSKAVAGCPCYLCDDKTEKGPL